MYLSLDQKRRACRFEIDGRKGCFLLANDFGGEILAGPGDMRDHVSLVLLCDKRNGYRAPVRIVWCFLDELRPDGKPVYHFVGDVEFLAPLLPYESADPNDQSPFVPVGIWSACERFLFENNLGLASEEGRSTGI